MMTTEATLPPFDRIDYKDHFRLVADTDRFESIEDFLKALALGQPSWLTKLSLGIGNADRLREAVGDGAFPAGSAIGNWRVLDRGETWAILGEDMGILTYRLLYRWVAEDTVDAESTLMWKTRFGKFYWLLAGPMHQRLLPRMMRNAVNGEGSTTQLA